MRDAPARVLPLEEKRGGGRVFRRRRGGTAGREMREGERGMIFVLSSLGHREGGDVSACDGGRRGAPAPCCVRLVGSGQWSAGDGQRFGPWGLRERLAHGYPWRCRAFQVRCCTTGDSSRVRTCRSSLFARNAFKGRGGAAAFRLTGYLLGENFGRHRMGAKKMLTAEDALAVGSVPRSFCKIVVPLFSEISPSLLFCDRVEALDLFVAVQAYRVAGTCVGPPSTGTRIFWS